MEHRTPLQDSIRISEPPLTSSGGIVAKGNTRYSYLITINVPVLQAFAPTKGDTAQLLRVILLSFLIAGAASAQLQIAAPSIPQASQYQSYFLALSATGGTPPYTWSVITSGGTGLPEGMSLGASSGIISATQVNGQGGYAVTVRVTDSGSPGPAVATRTLNIGVHSDSSYGGCPMFPPDSIYNQRVDKLPVDTDPTHQIPSAYLSRPLHPDFGTGFYPGPGGMPFMRVPANQASTNVNLANSGQVESAGTYTWPFPAWPNAPVEGTPYGLAGDDHHVLILETGTCTLYETYNDAPVPSMWDGGSGTWFFGAGVHYDLTGNLLAASADSLDSSANDSAGIPIVPLLVRYDEVPLGTQHPLRIVFPSPTDWFVWPATGCCSGSGPPQGLLYRLKASVNWQAACPVGTNPQAATVLQALQQFGAYMSDHGSTGYLGGAADDRWNDNDLACIKTFHVSDLEVVDNSALEVLAISGQTQPYVVPASLPNGMLNASYTVTFSAVGGNPANLQWSMISGVLPVGLVLNAGSGTISGTISSAAGNPFSFNMTATDTASGFASQPQSFTVTVTGLQTITFGPLSNQAFGTAPFVFSATASSGLTVSFTSTTTGVCTVSATTVTLAAGGTCTIQATQAGNGSYSAATPVNQTFQVTPLSQSIGFAALSGQPMGTAPFAVSATATSGLAVSFNSQTATVCTVSGATLTLVAVGSCTIQATQTGNSNYSAAAPVNQSFPVTQGGQTITFPALSSQPLGTAPFLVGTTATSGLAISLNSQTAAVCTISGATLTLVAVGSCTIQATQTGNSNYFVAAPVTQSFQVTQGTQTITFGTLANQALGSAAFTVGATASSGLAVSFNSQTAPVCTTSGASVTMIAAGTCTIQATQAGNSNYLAAAPANQSFLVTSQSQTVTFGALSSQPFGTTPFAVSATASSNLAVTFNSQTGAVCTVSGATATLVTAGTCTLQATQPGNSNFAPATPVNQSFQVTQATQTIAFTSLSTQVFGMAPLSVSATVSSGLSASFNSQTPSVCTVSGTTVTLIATGICTIQATQTGNGNYSLATPVNQSFSVTLEAQAIAFGTLANLSFGTPPFTVSATSSSGLATSFNSLTPAVCTVTGSTATLVAGGTCTIQATQAGNSNCTAAPPVNQSFQVTPGSQTIAFGAISSQAIGSGSFSIGATASSGLAVSFNSQTPAVCTVASVTVTLVALGACTLQATQAGNVNYAAANPASQSFQVLPSGQTLTFGTLSNLAFGSAPFPVSATASSGLAVSFNSQTSAVCSVSGTTVTMLSAGACTVQATQAGNSTYATANPVSQSFQVTQLTQTIAFASLPGKTFGNAPIVVGATATSGLLVSFNSQTSPVCSVTGTTVTVLSGGTCTLQAIQAGNTNYLAAAPVNQSFAIAPVTQTIAFGALAGVGFSATPVSIAATASSGLAVSFNSQTTPVCAVFGTTVTLVSAGTCTIQATQAGNASYLAASPVNQSFQINQGSQTIAFGTFSNTTYGTSPLTLNGIASSGLVVTFTSQTIGTCTVSGTTLTLLNIGTCTILATQNGNANYTAASAVSQTFLVAQATQTITFLTLSSAPLITPPFTISATSSSGLPVTFNQQTPAVCTVVGVTVTLVAAGICTIQANQSGNVTYAAATPVNVSVQITAGGQTIAFAALADQTFGTAPFTVSATASSGLPVTFSSTTPAVCTIASATVTLVAGGVCTIQAAQTGNPSYSAATPVSQSFQVSQGNQTINFGTLASQAFGNAPFLISANASSGLPVSFTSQTPAICTISGATVTLAAVGTCTFQATQAGNGTFGSASPVTQSFPVTEATQTITFFPLSGQIFGAAPFTVSATASSGLAVSFNSQSPTLCTVSGATVTLAAIGICTIQATQAGNAIYAGASPVGQSFQVAQGYQSISFSALSNQPLGAAPFPLHATASSGLTVGFGATTPAVCTLSGSVVTMVAPGTCTIQATQTGDPTYNAAGPVSQSFLVTAGLALPGSSSVNFPNTLVGKSSATLAVTLQNSGNAALTITSIAITGVDAANYQYTADALHPCPISSGTLGVGSSCTLDVTFAPVIQGVHNSAQITITDNSGSVVSAIQTIALTGSGIVLSSIFINGGNPSLTLNNSVQFSATGTYSDTTTADITRQSVWSSSATAVVSVNSAGVATAVAAGQVNITAALNGVTSNSFQVTVVGPAPVITAYSGGGQGMTVGNAFVSPLQAVVKDSLGNAIANAVVTFTAPASGTGAIFANGLTTYAAITNSAGLATTTVFAANWIFGSYSVTATTAGVGTPVSFPLTNLKAPTLSVTVSHTAGFTQWQTNAAYTVTVSNSTAGGATYGKVTLTEIMPTGLTLVSMNGGPSWNCAALPACTTTTVLPAGSSYPAITVTVSVSGTAAITLVNEASVSGGSSATAIGTDSTSIYSTCDLQQTGNVTISDLQRIINQALGIAPLMNDLNRDGVVNIQDVQIETNAVLGYGCTAT